MKLGTALRSLTARSSGQATPGGRPHSAESFPESLSVAGHELVLNGTGFREATIFNVRVYVAGIYAAARSSEVDTLLALSTPILLELRFVRDVDQGTMNEALASGFERNGGSSASLDETLRASADLFKSWVPDLKSGMRLRLCWVPGKGVSMEVDSQTMGTVPGEAFAASLFRIWLGAQPPNANLKSGLLGLTRT